MRIARRRAVMVACAGLIVCIGLAGCRSEPPPEPKKTQVPKIPDTAPKPPPTITPEKPRPITAPPRPAPTVPPPSAASKPVASKPVELPPPVVEKEPDAPDAPPYFPKGDKEVPGWVKAGPIRTVALGDLDKVLSDEIIASIKPYQIKRVSTCTYRGVDKTARQTAEVLLIQTHHPEDAYGIFTVIGTGAQEKVTGALMRSDVGAMRLTMHVWKGRQYVRVTGQAGDKSASKEACQALVRRITFLMPDSPVPALVEALPKDRAVPDKRWLVRDLASLSAPGAAEVRLPNADRVGKLLGLDRDSQMLIATYRAPKSDRSHLIWVVRYDRPEQARKAYEAYRAFLGGATDDFSSNTLVIRPKGQYLLGTWTAEEESLGPVLPALLSNLE